MRILLVDDDRTVLSTLKTILESDRYDVTALRITDEVSVSVILGKVDSEQPDIAIIGIAMPQMDGSELARAIRELSPSTWIVMNSPMRTIGSDMVARGEADAFVSRLFEMVDLKRALSISKNRT